MAESILYQVDDLTLTETHVIYRDTSVPYSSVGAASIQERRPLVWLGFAGVLAFAAACSARWWGAPLVGPRMSLKLGLLAAVPAAIAAVYGFTHRVACLQLAIATRVLTVLRRKDRYPVEVAQRVIATAKRAYGTADDPGVRGVRWRDLRSDLNPM